jgi:hypothetical protein
MKCQLSELAYQIFSMKLTVLGMYIIGSHVRKKSVLRRNLICRDEPAAIWNMPVYKIIIASPMKYLCIFSRKYHAHFFVALFCFYFEYGIDVLYSGYG